MRKRLTFLFLLLIILYTVCKSQASDNVSTQNNISAYPFIIQDKPAGLFTIRQVDEDYLSAYRLYAKVLNNNFRPIVSYSLQAASFLILFGALTHEESHRSVLTLRNIGSVSHPYFFSDHSGYVDGVTDQTLQSLRDNDFPDYIRLYTAGFESDYMLNWRAQTILAFNDDVFKNIAVEYLMRKFILMRYTLMGFFKYDIDGPEEKNELERDIVGNDFYGAIRHLFRPTMTFKRYTLYNDLTPEEHTYMRKIGYRTLINLVDPNMLGFANFALSDAWKMNAALGHVMCLFGDFIDEKFWFMYKNKLKLTAYLRQFENKDHLFWAGGIGVSDYPLHKRVNATFNVHLWNQPVNLSFNDLKGKVGGALELITKYRFFTNQKSWLKALSIDAGIIFKTKGFLPEDMYLQKHWGIRFGSSIEIAN